jgi:hypothetical protein
MLMMTAAAADGGQYCTVVNSLNSRRPADRLPVMTPVLQLNLAARVKDIEPDTWLS